MISPQGLMFYRGISIISALILTAVLFLLASRFFSATALMIGMLIPVVFVVSYGLVWQLVLPKGAYGHVDDRHDSGEAK